MLKYQIEHLVQQIETILLQLTDEEYSRPLAVFNSSSVGQHTRHVIEFFQELEKGYATGVVDYDNRRRNKLLETNRNNAVESLKQVISICEKPEKLLQLNIHHGLAQKTDAIITTTYYRELAYVLDHTVHHMALIRIGVEQLRNVEIPAGFGIASSTQFYQSTCAQ